MLACRGSGISQPKEVRVVRSGVDGSLVCRISEVDDLREWCSPDDNSRNSENEQDERSSRHGGHFKVGFA
jgi:hypothetical protein